MSESLLTVAQAADIANVSTQTIRNAYERDDLPGTPLGRAVGFTREAVEKFKRERAAKLLALAKRAAK